MILTLNVKEFNKLWVNVNKHHKLTFTSLDTDSLNASKALFFKKFGVPALNLCIKDCTILGPDFPNLTFENLEDIGDKIGILDGLDLHVLDSTATYDFKLNAPGMTMTFNLSTSRLQETLNLMATNQMLIITNEGGGKIQLIDGTRTKNFEKNGIDTNLTDLHLHLKNEDRTIVLDSAWQKFKKTLDK